LAKDKSKVTIKKLDRVLLNVRKVFDNTIQSQQLLNSVGEYSADRIAKQTQSGKQLTVLNGEAKVPGKQPPLSPGYKKYRRRLANGDIKNSRVTPDKNMRPNTSHLTLTGKLLSSLKYRVIKTRGWVEVFPYGSRKKYKRNDPSTNKELAKDLAKRGRSFLGMDPKGELVIKKMINRVLRRNIRNFNK